MTRPTKDLKDLTGDPFTDIADISDRPDGARMDQMRQRIIEKVNSLPMTAQSFSGWEDKGRDGISMSDLYGDRYSQRDGMDDQERELAFNAAWSQVEHLSGPEIEALDERDRRSAAFFADLNNEFQRRYPALANDPRLEVAIAMHYQEITENGKDPGHVIASDPMRFLESVANMIPMLEKSEGRATEGRADVSYGNNPSAKYDPDPDKLGSLIDELREEQRKLGIYG
jgi:hypothetical protein